MRTRLQNNHIPLDISPEKLLIETPYGKVNLADLPDAETPFGHLFYLLLRSRGRMYAWLNSVAAVSEDLYLDKQFSDEFMREFWELIETGG